MAKKKAVKKKVQKYPRRLIAQGVPPEYKYPWKDGDYVLILGEIVGMPGHYVFVTEDGKTHFGYHLSYFRELDPDD
jgi:hypothetical protein